MKYKGSGKHSIEELEQIIDEMIEAKTDAQYETDSNKLMLSKTAEIIREIYEECVDLENHAYEFEEKKITGEKIVNNVRKYLERFSKDNKFKLI